MIILLETSCGFAEKRFSLVIVSVCLGDGLETQTTDGGVFA